jgi:hypothetical protein
MPNLSETSILVATGSQVSADLAGETAILSLSDGVYYGLDAVGSRIWQLLQQPVSIAAIRDTLLGEYDVTPERCTEDIHALVQQLLKHGLIEVAGEPVV